MHARSWARSWARTVTPVVLMALVMLAAASVPSPAQAADPMARITSAYPGIGRPATPKELAAWDIDVRPDFKGLPKGSGSVSQGQDVWEAKCASCHGVFGESNEVFAPIIGGTTREDVANGRAKRLTDPGFPGRTTMMKLSSVASLWDYVNRAMPWTAPKSLKTDEVYAVVAYMLNLAFVVPDDFTLSDANIAQVQARLPNRNGMTTDHGLWPGRGLGNGGKPDVRATACMKDCAVEATVASYLPDHARNAHGNLAEQNRLVGPQRGADTTRPPGVPIARADAAGTAGATGAAAAGAASTAAAAANATASASRPATPPAAVSASAAATALFSKHGCTACHGIDRKVMGPAMQEVARKHSARADALAYLSGRIQAGGAGVWGSIPMPAQAIPRADADLLAQWIAAGAAR